MPLIQSQSKAHVVLTVSQSSGQEQRNDVMHAAVFRGRVTSCPTVLTAVGAKGPLSAFLAELVEFAVKTPAKVSQIRWMIPARKMLSLFSAEPRPASLFQNSEVHQGTHL